MVDYWVIYGVNGQFLKWWSRCVFGEWCDQDTASFSSPATATAVAVSAAAVLVSQARKAPVVAGTSEEALCVFWGPGTLAVFLKNGISQKVWTTGVSKTLPGMKEVETRMKIIGVSKRVWTNDKQMKRKLTSKGK